MSWAELFSRVGAKTSSATKIKAKAKPERRAVANDRAALAHDEKRYLGSILENAANHVRNAEDGSRNDELNKAAFQCAQYDGLSESEIEDALSDAALASGLEEAEIARTIASGISAGRKDLRDVDEELSGPKWSASRTLLVAGGFIFENERMEDASVPASECRVASLDTVTQKVSDLIQRRADGLERPVPLPFPDYADSMNGGLWPGTETLVGLTGSLKSLLAVQKILHAAKLGIPCLLVTLELTQVQVVLRLMCEYVGVSWSKCEVGTASFEEWEAIRNASETFCKLPIVLVYAMPQAFTPAALNEIVQRIRKQFPTDPIHVLIDFAQLLAPDQRSSDIRERVGSVFYGLQAVARQNDVAMSIISSTARQNYSLLADVGHAAKLEFEDGVRIVGNPAAVLAAAKESGEAEYASDVLWVMCKWPARLENGDTIIICVQGKRRHGACTWFALRASHGRLYAFPVASMSDLPVAEVDRGGKRKVDDADIEARILEYVAKNDVTSVRQLRGRGIGSVFRVGQLWNELSSNGGLVQGEDKKWKVAK